MFYAFCSHIVLSALAFVICQSNIGFRMVPSTVAYNFRGKPINNVGSGTYIPDGDSFYLVAQGGMKGTSKPVKYVVHVNENSAPVDGRSIGLTLENLIECTFYMAWKYPSATKVCCNGQLIHLLVFMGANCDAFSLSYFSLSPGREGNPRHQICKKAWESSSGIAQLP